MFQKCLRVSKADAAVFEVLLKCPLLKRPFLDTELKQFLFAPTGQAPFFSPASFSSLALAF